jgi:hypothetical protein
MSLHEDKNRHITLFIYTTPTVIKLLLYSRPQLRPHTVLHMRGYIIFIRHWRLRPLAGTYIYAQSVSRAGSMRLGVLITVALPLAERLYTRGERRAQWNEQI